MCIPAPPVWPVAPPSPALRKPRPAFTAHAVCPDFSSSLSSSRTSSAGNTTPCPSRSLPAAASPPGCGAALSPARVVCFDADERREAPRLIYRLVRVVSVCTVVSLSPSQPYHVPPVYATATSTPSGHAPAAIPFRHSPSQRVVEVAALDQWLACCIRVWNTRRCWLS